MQRMTPGWLAVLLLVVAEGRAGAAAPPTPSDPRDVIRRAIRAMGGQDLLTRKLASYHRYDLRFDAPLALEITGEGYLQPGGRPMRIVYRSKPGSTFPIDAVVVLNGEKSWKSRNGKVEDLKAADLADLTNKHTDEVLSLVPLLTGKRFEITLFPGGLVDDKPVQGVKVSAKGETDVHLSFDKASGLLVKHSYRTKQGGKEVLLESVMRNHRDMSGAWDEGILKEAGAATDDRSLLAFLRRQIAAPAQLARVRDLIEKLGDDAFRVREKAEADLLDIGPVALPALRKAAKDKDLEVRKRAFRCVRVIEKTAGKAVVAAVVGHLARRRTAGAAEVLLALLPGADEALAEDVRAALAALAERDGKPEPALLTALTSKDPIQRSAAAAVLGKDGGAYLQKPGRRIFFSGLLTPSIVQSTSDGRNLRMEEVEVRYYNQLEDKLFAKP